jgi:hypothetical protein
MHEDGTDQESDSHEAISTRNILVNNPQSKNEKSNPLEKGWNNTANVEMNHTKIVFDKYSKHIENIEQMELKIGEKSSNSSNLTLAMEFKQRTEIFKNKTIEELKNISSKHNATSRKDMRLIGNIVKQINNKLRDKVDEMAKQLNLTEDQITILKANPKAGQKE